MFFFINNVVIVFYSDYSIKMLTLSSKVSGLGNGVFVTRGPDNIHPPTMASTFVCRLSKYGNLQYGFFYRNGLRFAYLEEDDDDEAEVQIATISNKKEIVIGFKTVQTDKRINNNNKTFNGNATDIKPDWFNSDIQKRIKKQLRTFENKEREDLLERLQEKSQSLTSKQLEKVIKWMDKL